MTRSTMSRGALAALLFGLVAAAPAAAVPITVTQSVTLNQVQPFGTFTSFALTATGWSTNPFPFTEASQISQIRISFDSNNPDYLDGTGPGGGATAVAIYVLNDALQRIALTSLNHATSTVLLSSAQGSFFTTVRDLALDGRITFSLGAYEAFSDRTGLWTLNGPSTLRLEVSGDVPAPVPEPTTMALLATGLLGLPIGSRLRTWL